MCNCCWVVRKPFQNVNSSFEICVNVFQLVLGHNACTMRKVNKTLVYFDVKYLNYKLVLVYIRIYSKQARLREILLLLLLVSDQLNLYLVIYLCSCSTS